VAAVPGDVSPTPWKKINSIHHTSTLWKGCVHESLYCGEPYSSIGSDIIRESAFPWKLFQSAVEVKTDFCTHQKL
jgi:hypothetical protein